MYSTTLAVVLLGVFSVALAEFCWFPDRTYDPNDAMCCNGTILNKEFGSDSRCCGKMMYDQRINKCCHVWSKDDRVQIAPLSVPNRYCVNPTYFNMRKCGESQEQYDRRSHICCGGVVKERPYGPYSRCCGTEVYFNQQSKCCKIFGSDRVIVQPLTVPNRYCIQP